MGSKAVQTAPATWPLVLVRSIGPPLVAAAVLAVARPPWPQWAAHAFFLVLLVPVAILTVDRVFGGRAALILGITVVALTGWLAVGPVPTTHISPLGRSAGWLSDAALVQHRWHLPLRSAAWQAAWERTELAIVRVRLDIPDRAQTAGVAVVLNGVQLPALDREGEGTWFRTPVTRKQLESSPSNNR